MLDPTAATDPSILAKWPIAEGFFVIVITFLGVAAWRRGERDSKGMSNNVSAMDMPTYLQAHDANEERRKTNAILADIAKNVTEFNQGQRHTHTLLNQVINNQEMRTTMAHPSSHKSGL
jgi:hypothetical protein